MPVFVRVHVVWSVRVYENNRSVRVRRSTEVPGEAVSEAPRARGKGSLPLCFVRQFTQVSPRGLLAHEGIVWKVLTNTTFCCSRVLSSCADGPSNRPVASIKAWFCCPFHP